MVKMILLDFVAPRKLSTIIKRAERGDHRAVTTPEAGGSRVHWWDTAGASPDAAGQNCRKHHADRPLSSRTASLGVKIVPMRFGDAVIFDQLDSVQMERSHPIIYDREIELRLLHQDPDSGAEHYLVRYPAGLKARPHRHGVAHTIVVLKGRLAVNSEVVGPGAYCHFPAGESMFHAPADGGSCLFVTIFHGPFDVEPLGDDPTPPPE